MAEFDLSQARENRLLASLPRNDLERIASTLQPVTLKRGETLYHEDTAIDYVYFPTGALVSLVASMQDGTIVEVAVVGREGMVGLPLALGTDTSPRRVVAQAPGGALKLSAEGFRRELSNTSALTERLKRYTMIHLTQTTQWVACNRLHSLEKRLARWLLASADATGSEQFELTQDFIAQMLGVRRPSVTVIVRGFEKQGMVQTSRGRIRISDRGALERAVCECYAFVRRQIDKDMLVEVSRS
ncbi:MAG: Crp/Fnr family transcriptional regulator [Gaiellales bacterium]